jgi:hypothetical protein
MMIYNLTDESAVEDKTMPVYVMRWRDHYTTIRVWKLSDENQHLFDLKDIRKNYKEDQNLADVVAEKLRKDYDVRGAIVIEIRG